MEKAFGDNVLYVDASQGPSPLAAEILERVGWVRDNYHLAQQKAFEAHSLLQQNYTCERLLMNVIEMHDKVLVAKGYRPAPDEDPDALPSISYIMRTGGGSSRPLRMVRRALDSLVAQNYPRITVIYVLHAPFSALKELVDDYPSLSHKFVSATGCMRSTAIIEGIRAADTDLFGLLDDDDEFHPNHVRSLVKTLAYHNERDLRGKIAVAYSGSVEVGLGGHREEWPEWHDRFMLPRYQRYCIEHFRWYRSNAMAEYNFFMMSNSWLTRRDLVNEDVLTDPFMDTGEDLYFEIQFAHRSHFGFSCEVTAIHHFHDSNGSVFEFSKTVPDTRRIALRNWQRSFPAEIVYHNRGHIFGDQQANGEIPLGKNIISRLFAIDGSEIRGDIVHFDKSVPTGIALYGPYARLLPGHYKLAVFVEFSDLDDDAEGGLHIDVVCDGGNIVIIEAAFPSAELQQGGRLRKLEASFVITPEFAEREIEFRLWRQSELNLDVLRIVLDRAPGRIDDDRPMADFVARAAILAQPALV